MKEILEYILAMCIFLIALLVSNWSVAIPKNNILFGLTLPNEKLTDKDIIDITKKYKIACLLLIFFLLQRLLQLFLLPMNHFLSFIY